MPDVLFILVLALVIFGPKKLPEVMRQAAKFLAQFRMMRDDLKRQIEGEMLKIEMEERQKNAAPAPPLPLPSTTPVESPAVTRPLDGNLPAAN